MWVEVWQLLKLCFAELDILEILISMNKLNSDWSQYLNMN